ncbi:MULTISPECIES: DUF4123 domain-containing protein [unclassified Methylobacterium]|uniref:DUF4123 domain-containing protein n=1 Tax=unclassified Methylobacterium TaxID=2615210 RepID=UPI0036FA8611
MSAAPGSDREDRTVGQESDVRDRLSAVVRAFSRPGYALLDGGLFEDLPLLLRRAGLFARSLFLDHADKEVEAAGPWLVALDQGEDTLAKVFALAGTAPAVVFWSCPGGDRMLYRHLRALNRVRIPAWAANGLAGPARSQSAETFETVLFRHWDPHVLGALMPVLEADQFARIMGAAEEIAFAAPDFGGLKRILKDASWPPASSGMLTIGSAQADALNQRRLEASRRRIAGYLRESAPVMTEHATDRQLLDFVRESERHGRALGLESEAAHGRWAYLMLRSEGRILHTPRAIAFIRTGDAHPDEQVRELLARTASAIRRREADRMPGRGP